MLRFVLRLLSKALVGIILALLVLLAPDVITVSGIAGAVSLPLGVIILVCAIGKALYDTLFYDHYGK